MATPPLGPVTKLAPGPREAELRSTGSETGASVEVGLDDVASVVVMAGVLVLVKRTPWARAPGAMAPSKASEKRILKLLLKRQLSESGKGTKDV